HRDEHLPPRLITLMQIPLRIALLERLVNRPQQDFQPPQAIGDGARCRKYSVNPSPALAFSRSDGYSRPSWTTDQPPCSVSRPCGSQSRNWHPSPLVRHRIPRHRNPFVPPRLSPSAPVRFARG